MTLDQTNQGKLFNLILVGWATDGVSLPLGFVVYPVHGAWAVDARALLHRLEELIPSDKQLVLLADRVHAGDPFLTCLDQLGWGSYCMTHVCAASGIQHWEAKARRRHRLARTS